MEKIPKQIHLISADKLPPDKYQNCIDRMLELHPVWKINVWDDAAALSMVKEYFPHWVADYAAFKIPVQRADIFRAMIVFIYGGFYLDMDMFCLKPLDELCKYDIVLGIEKTLSKEECTTYGHRHAVRIANYMFGSRAGHGLLFEFLEQARLKAGMAIQKESDVLETTGPGLFTNVFHRLKNKYDDILLLSNTDRACRVACGPAACHFGDYAAHLHFGSWRWENQSYHKNLDDRESTINTGDLSV